MHSPGLIRGDHFSCAVLVSNMKLRPHSCPVSIAVRLTVIAQDSLIPAVPHGQLQKIIFFHFPGNVIILVLKDLMVIRPPRRHEGIPDLLAVDLRFIDAPRRSIKEGGYHRFLHRKPTAEHRAGRLFFREIMGDHLRPEMTAVKDPCCKGHLFRIFLPVTVCHFQLHMISLLFLKFLSLIGDQHRAAALLLPAVPHCPSFTGHDQTVGLLHGILVL